MAYSRHLGLLSLVLLFHCVASHLHHHGTSRRRYASRPLVKRQTSCDPTSKYRTYDGTCNNVNNPRYGATFETFRRWLDPVYDDGVMTPRSKASSGNPLPNPRDVSTIVHDPLDFISPSLNHMTMQWGQFLDHDLTLTPTGEGTDCCYDSLLDGETHPDIASGGYCMPIIIPEGDRYFTDRAVRCMYFERSDNLTDDNGVRQQYNRQTAWIDGSQVYGVDQSTADDLRSFQDGKLKVTSRNGNDFLPIDDEATADEDSCFLRDGTDDFCFKAGDPRVNVYPGLNALHTVFLRYHNLLCDRLKSVNQGWDDETLFQEARRIVVAVLQRISYDQFLLMVLGDTESGSLRSDSSTYSYDETIDATLPNVFSTAAFRFGHSMVSNSLTFGTTNVVTGLLFNRPGFVLDSMQDVIDAITREGSQHTDRWYTTGMTDQMFEKPDEPFTGFDIAARNIQRGRDHGLPGLNKWREFCEDLQPHGDQDWAALDGNGGTARRLPRVYESTDDIDLYTGGVTEKSDGQNVGQTFSCLLKKAFGNLRSGDRFWYENTADPVTSFTTDQIASISSTTLSHVLCDTIDGITSIQRNIFRIVSDNNPLVNCGNLRGGLDVEGLWVNGGDDSGADDIGNAGPGNTGNGNTGNGNTGNGNTGNRNTGNGNTGTGNGNRGNGNRGNRNGGNGNGGNRNGGNGNGGNGNGGNRGNRNRNRNNRRNN